MLDVTSNRKLALVATIVVLAMCICLFLLKLDTFRNLVGEFLAWVETEGLVGAICFVVVYAIAAMIFFPILIMTLGVGYVYSSIYDIWTGLLIGSLLVFLGAIIAASISMPIGRYLLRGFIQDKVKDNDAYLALEESINDHGFELVALWRLPPLLPFTIFNYVVGVTSISYRDYFLASFAMIPGCFVEVYIGTSLSSIQEALEGRLEGGSLMLGLVIGLLVVCLGGMAYVSILAKRKIDRILASRPLANAESKN